MVRADALYASYGGSNPSERTLRFNFVDWPVIAIWQAFTIYREKYL